ncbi:hypothetical protein COCSUDRAFT_58542 [Coccomyxa subellipsoidea C-169]|uniref:Uncharacterized protein n=1 Tax=Coccomyxa subellipsoidea (strain C-169) TaxID=574566 RepID=I0YN47_COCSC|nr:hypothetical protein COCSUDRAFT_58542 [Coccomyxa subellipsoidea C-169]EIE19816.1 hypothetical protein COCSUDRAFT_58542 [Coccomyxa subellipsoidea C-169]|eukprot:XP_005644360.1 hypothetical protein COCSUDRAFT_58542 [Coccomyxa subellipsoidea C-169]
MGQPCIKSAIRAAHRKGSRLRFRHLDKATTVTLASPETPAGTAAKNRGLSGRLPEPPRVARADSGVPEAGGHRDGGQARCASAHIRPPPLNDWKGVGRPPEGGPA